MDSIDHLAAARTALAQQYKDKPTIDAILSVFMDELNVLEATLSDLFSKRELGTAEGAQLDGWGRILNAARNGMTDTDYRAVLVAVMAGYNSSGTPEQLIALVEMLLRPAQPIELQEETPGNLTIEAEDCDPLLSTAEVSVIMQRSKAAGVGLDVILTPAGPYFGFDEDTNPDAAGFDDGTFSDVI